LAYQFYIHGQRLRRRPRPAWNTLSQVFVVRRHIRVVDTADDFLMAASRPAAHATGLDNHVTRDATDSASVSRWPSGVYAKQAD
jgi:hypothetical protein